MKKLIILFSGVIFLSSCKKETLPEPTSEWKGATFVRVETVNKEGNTSYSNVAYVNVK